MSMRTVTPAVLAVFSLVAMWGCQVDYHAASVPYDRAALTKTERAELNNLKVELDQTRTLLANTRAELTGTGMRLNAVEGAVQEIKSGALVGSQSWGELVQRLADLETEVRTQRELLRIRENELRLLQDAALPSGKTPDGAGGEILKTPDPGALKPDVVAKTGSQRQVAAVTPIAAQDYENAWKRLKEKDYRRAIQQFKKFVENHSNSSLTDNAQYWIGESYYALKDFDQAISEFDKVRERYPDGDKVPAAWLKMGFAFSELGEHATARLILQEVIRKYPQSETAKKARDKIQALDT